MSKDDGRAFHFQPFVDTVFGIEQGETVLFLTDTPTRRWPTNVDWEARSTLVRRWRDQFALLGSNRGFKVLPLLSFDAAGTDNGVFPECGYLDGELLPLHGVLERATLAIAMTEFSMTAALMQEVRRRPGARRFRAASMPLARQDMEGTCLDVDYGKLRQRCHALHRLITDSIGLEVEFTTGHRCQFDLRHRQAYVDDGYLHRDKVGPPMINLPSGEVWIVPYEGERAEDPSRTEGSIPVAGPDGSVAVFVIRQNRIVRVEGDGQARAHYEAILEVDPMRTNVGEVSFGCNDRARVSGLFIEDEKAGFHWGFGRSEFLGGTVGVEHFRTPETVLHHDVPYARGCPITVTATLIGRDGVRSAILEEGRYLL